jgi:gliding motility-associated-like protein
MKKLYTQSFIILLLSCFASRISAQVDRDFWFAIPKETNGHMWCTLTNANAAQFRIAAMDQPSQVTISMPANPSFTPIVLNILANQTQTYILTQDPANYLANWIAFDSVYANPANFDFQPTNKGITNHGIHITATNDITVYYDYDNKWNRDLFSLKGQNALGTTFFMPFQNIWVNQTSASYSNNGAGTCTGTYRIKPLDAYSEFDVVATQNGTIVNVFNSNGTLVATSPTLSAGQTYSYVATAQTAAAHMTGYSIVANNPVAVTINDDSVMVSGGQCADIIGDQLVPNGVVGTKYLVMTGDDGTPAVGGPHTKTRNEQIFVVASQANTRVIFRDTSSGNGSILLDTTIGAGKFTYLSPDRTNGKQSSIYVESVNGFPIYIMHITGHGCETGGAVLPPITNCTGSVDVSVVPGMTGNKSDGSDSRITMNLMVPYDTLLAFNDPAQAHYHFLLFNSVSPPGGTVIPGTWFEPNRHAHWAVLKMSCRSWSPGNAPYDIMKFNETNRFTNSVDFFHLGMSNGFDKNTNKYGYFSSFNVVNPGVRISGTNSHDFIGCFGDTVTLIATGGRNYRWHYGSPSGISMYLTGSNTATPKATNLPVGDHNFYVEIINQRCFPIDTQKVFVKILPVVTVNFDIDPPVICAIDSVYFTNLSKNAQKYKWERSIDHSLLQPVSTNQDIADEFRNPTNVVKEYRYRLTASSNQGCNDTISKVLLVYPEIYADFTPKDTVGCHPFNVQFNSSNSSGNLGTYKWDFGDQSASDKVNPQHTFQNFYNHDTTYITRLEVKAPLPIWCTDTTSHKITVHPYIHPEITVDTVTGCSPMTITVHNSSVGAISNYTWDFGDGTVRTGYHDTLRHTYPVNTSLVPIKYKLKLTVTNASPTGCPESDSTIISVNPQTSITFTASAYNICDSAAKVKFTSTPSAAVSSYYWQFGDGNTSVEANPEHGFRGSWLKDTTYIVQLKVTSLDHCESITTDNILVHARLDPVFTVGAATNCAPFPANITNNSRGGIIRYSWTYQDAYPDSHSVRDTVHNFDNLTLAPVKHTISLQVFSSGNCVRTKTQDIMVNPAVHANWSPSSGFAGCNPFPVKFANLSNTPIAQRFYWDFGDGVTTDSVSPSHIFNNNAQNNAPFTIKLIAYSSQNCTDTFSNDIIVHSYIKAKFDADPVEECSPLTVHLTNVQLPGISNYTWNYGFGPPDNNPGPSITKIFPNITGGDVTYTVRLTVSNTGGCQEIATKNILVHPQVKASFTQDVTEGCNPLNVRFFDNSTPWGIPTKFTWEFGDGATSPTRNTSHIFENLGSSLKTFRTKLTVASLYGCEDTLSRVITVYPFIEPAFSFDPSFGCSPLTVNIRNNSSAGVNSFHWVFGDLTPDVTTPLRNFTHTFSNPGPALIVYKPKLIVAYNNGTTDMCLDTITHDITVHPEITALFDQDTLKGCHPKPIQFINRTRIGSSPAQSGLTYLWDFGDNGLSNLTNPLHTYNNFSNVDAIYNVQLTAIYNINTACRNTITKQVTIYPKPKPLFYTIPSNGCGPLDVSIENNSEVSGTYYWTFGDSNNLTTASMATMNHVYDNYTANDVTYPLKLRIETPYNCTDSSTRPIIVHPRTFADFSPDTSGCSPLYVQFRNNSTRGKRFDWDFGDGVPSGLVAPPHKFFNYSMYDTTYTVTMISYSNFGCIDTTTRQVTVYPQPEAKFSAEPRYLNYPENRINIGNQTSPPGFWNYAWNFGDGVTSADKEPVSHEYIKWGVYTVSLNAWSNHCSDSTSVRITVKPPVPIPDFDMTPSGCVPLTVEFTDRSTWATSWRWDFGDGSPATSQNPTHIYETAGEYVVKLYVSGDGGQDIQTARTIYAYPTPVVDFKSNTQLVMLDKATIQFYNLSKYGTRYLWDFGDSTKSGDFELSHTYHAIGTYSVSLHVVSEHNCMDSMLRKDYITVIGTGVLQFPNAFTPSTDGPSDGKYDTPDTKNQVFHPFADGVSEYHLEIYDRWGEKIFETNDIEKGWDGYYRNKLCKTDVYIYNAKGKYTNGKTFDKSGNLTLLR